MSNRKFLGVAVSVLAVIVGTMMGFISGCPTAGAPGGGGGGGGGLKLSSAKLNPGQFLTLSQSSIVAGSTVNVRFEGPDGFDVEVETILTDNGSAKVAVPPLIDMQTGEFLEGEVQVSLTGSSGGSAALTIQSLPRINSPSPGALLREVFLMSLELADAAEAKAAAIAADLPGAVESPSDLEFFTQQRAAVAAILEELDATGQLTVEAGNGTIVTLTAQDLAMCDRLLAGYLVGIIDETGGDSTVALKATAQFQGEGGSILDYDALKEEFRRAANNIVNGGGAFLGSMTLIVAGGGLLLVGTGPVAAVGGIVLTAGGAVWAIGSSSILNRIGSFFDEKLGGLYNLGQTAFSQAISFGTTALGTLEGKLGQLFSGISSLLTAKGTYDNFTQLECQTNPAPEQKRSAVNSRSDEFCVFVLPDADMACSNDCEFAYDGVCDDGGAGSDFDDCVLGTDCADCGPRDLTTEPEPEPEPDDGGGTDGGGAFTILGFTNTDGAIESGPTLDPTRAQIQLSGDPSSPTFSWTGVSGVFSIMVTMTSEFFPQPVYGIAGETPPDENGDTEQVTFAFSSVTYGTYGLPNTVPLEGPAGPLGPADAIPLSQGLLVSVTIGTLNAEIATLSFRVD